MTDITYTFDELTTLANAYMFFVEGGGIFIPTHKAYALGQEIEITINLKFEPEETYTTTGKVIWLTPVGAQDHKIAGIGVQLVTLEGTKMRNRIEALLQTTPREQIGGWVL